MVNNIDMSFVETNIENNIQIIKTIFMILCTYYVNFRISNKKFKYDREMLSNIFYVIIISIICVLVMFGVNYFTSLICSVFLLGIIFSKNDIKTGLMTTIISFIINYIISFIAVIINFGINLLVQLESNYINLIIIIAIRLAILYKFLRVKRLKYGISFLKKSKENQYVDILILNIGIIILFFGIAFFNSDVNFAMNIFPALIIVSIIMNFTIQKSLQLYYKQKLLVQDLNETKAELESTKKELQKVEQENLSFSKKSHSLAHKQKSLEYKLNQLLQNAEIGEEIGISKDEIESRIKHISKELYTESAPIELTKTGIIEIDDMLKYMQSECIKSKIEFNVQIGGNIYHMINELITKEDLEILLADHIKNAIIAINHSENSNKSILVKLGKIDNIYSLYIYDTGVEFKKETLENLGKVPSTTYANEGGTGMGFMNTFDTLRRSSASLIIEEIGEPSKDNYTKAIIIKFDKKNEFNIKSYKEEKSCN